MRSAWSVRSIRSVWSVWSVWSIWPAVALALVLGSLGACSPGPDGSAPAEAPGTAAPAPHESQREPQVHLDAEARALAGVEVAPLAALELPAEREAYGRVLDPAPLAGLVYEVEAARAADAAAEREARRVADLYRGDENASARELEAAQVAQARARGALETARARLTSGWGAALAGRADLAALVQDLVAGVRALVRIDVPPGGPQPEEPGAAPKLVAFGAQTPLAASFLGVAPQTDPQLQGRGLLFLAEDGPPAPGTAVAAWLRVPGAPTRGVEVPRSAVLRHAGGTFVFVERAPGTYARRAVTLVRPSAQGWLATGRLAAGDRVVVSGAAILLSSELQPQLAED